MKFKIENIDPKLDENADTEISNFDLEFPEKYEIGTLNLQIRKIGTSKLQIRFR